MATSQKESTDPVESSSKFQCSLQRQENIPKINMKSQKAWQSQNDCIQKQ